MLTVAVPGATGTRVNPPTGTVPVVPGGSATSRMTRDVPSGVQVAPVGWAVAGQVARSSVSPVTMIRADFRRSPAGIARPTACVVGVPVVVIGGRAGSTCTVARFTGPLTA